MKTPKQYYTKDGRKIVDWIKTKKGATIYITEGQTKVEAIDTFFKSHNMDPKAMSYDRFDDNKDMAETFAKDTGIVTSVAVQHSLHHDTFAGMLDTYKALYDKYGNDLGIDVITDTTDTDILPRDGKTVMAAHPDRTLYIDTDAYKYKTPQRLTNDYQEDVLKNHNVPGDYRSVFVHEAGHAVFNKKFMDIADKLNATEQERIEAYNYIKNMVYDNKLYTRNRLYKYTVNELNKLRDILNSDKKLNGPDISKNTIMTYNTYLKYYNGNRVRKYNGISKYGQQNYHELIAESFSDVVVNKSKASYLSKLVYDIIYKKGG